MTTKTAAKTTGAARDRLLTAADELFYTEGVHSVGVDRLIEQAGVAKASLYTTFGSKEALIRAYLEGRHARIADHITGYIDRYETPRERLLGVFEAQGELFAEPNFRGCAFVAASAEADVREQIEGTADDYRSWLRHLLTDLADQAGAGDPAGLARQLHIVFDGGNLAARMDRNPGVWESSRAAAEALLDAAPTGVVSAHG